MGLRVDMISRTRTISISLMIEQNDVSLLGSISVGHGEKEKDVWGGYRQYGVHARARPWKVEAMEMEKGRMKEG